MDKARFTPMLLGCLLTLPLWAATPDEPPVNTPAFNTTQHAALSARVADVVESNPRVQAARAAVEAAQAQERAAAQPLFNPELEFEAERSEEEGEAIYDTVLGVNQTIDWADKREARTDVAGFEQEAAQAELAAIRQDLAGNLLSALADYQTAQELEQLAAGRVELMRRLAALAERRYRAGDLSQVELDLARLALSEADLQLTQAAVTLSEAEQALVAITGDLPIDWPPLPVDLPAPADFDIEARLLTLPALRVQQAQVAAARSTIKLRVRERTPDPTIGLRGGREDEEALVGVTFSIPLFIRNTFRAEVDAANAQAIRAEQDAQDVYRQARARLISAMARYRQTRQAWQAWQQAGRPSLASQTALLQRLWRAGELNTTDYVVQLNQTVDTRAAALELRGRLWGAWADWLVASGEMEQWLELTK